LKQQAGGADETFHLARNFRSRVSSPRSVGAWLLACAGAAGVAGCLVTSSPTYEPAPGSLVEGAIFCSLCWNAAFCFNPADGVSTRYGGFLIQRSASLGTASVIGGQAGVSLGDWSITDASELSVSFAAGGGQSHKTTCSEVELLREGFARYDRAPDSLSKAISGGMDTGSFTSLPDSP
jgi:hypothetical protein